MRNHKFIFGAERPSLPCAKGGVNPKGLTEGLTTPQSCCSHDSPLYTRGPFCVVKKLTYPAGRQYRAAPGPPGIPEKHRHR